MFHFLVNTAQAVSLPNFGESKDLASFINSIYGFSLAVVGIVVFIQIIRGGWLWLTAAGNSSKTDEARKIFNNAVIGAVLLFAAYLILYVINPDLVKNTLNFDILK